MALPLAPGVYFQRADSPTWAVEEARSDIAGFVGIAERGPLHQPVRVENWTQFSTRFGRSQRDYAILPDAVKGFFANGGRTAWIVRVGRPVDPSQHASLLLVNKDHVPIFRVWAKDPGLGGATISVRVLPAVRERFHLAVVVDVDGPARETLELWKDLEGNKYLSNSDSKNVRASKEAIANPRYVEKVVNVRSVVATSNKRTPDFSPSGGSVLIEIQDISDGLVSAKELRVVGVVSPQSLACGDKQRTITAEMVKPEARLSWEITPKAGTSLSQYSVLNELKPEHFVGDADNEWGLAALEKIDEVALIAMPDLMWQKPVKKPYIPARQPCILIDDENLSTPNEPIENRVAFTDEREQVQLEMLSHCARMRNRFAVLDAPYECDAIRVQDWAKKLKSVSGQFGALYFPWIGVSTSDPGVRWMPPSGHVAGLFARVDLSSGVQKSPANEPLVEVQGVMHEVEADTHGQLNLEGVNLIKATGTRGVRVMGARTLIDPLISELQPWRYVSVRRLLLMLEKSLEQSAYWLVHTDNRAERWRDVERVVRAFLQREWRIGRLGGATPEEAYSVECNESTNPWEEVERGRMTCVIGVQPPLPAEFVFVRLGDRGGDAGAWSFGGSPNGTA